MFNESDQMSMFNVKTIKVCWENNSSSYLHVFINIDEIQKLERAKIANKCQQAMFASISHEFRTPLNAFMNSLELIDMHMHEVTAKLFKNKCSRDEVSSIQSKYEKYAKIGRISCKLLLSLIEDLLDMAKFNAKKLKINIEEFKLCELLQEINYIFCFQCEEKHLNFNIQCDRSVANYTYRSDAKRIKQILINLISNSCKFTQSGKVEINVKRMHHKNKNGIGINKSDIPKLFQMFGMLCNSKECLNKSGTGIGLSISKMLVDLLGGEISIDSEEGKWTKFTFTVEDIPKSQKNISALQISQLLYESQEPEVANDDFDSSQIVYESLNKFAPSHHQVPSAPNLFYFPASK